jgi:hypothetical protein
MSKYEYEVVRKVDLPGGGAMTVTVSSPSPIDEADYLILRDDTAIAMGECLVDLANAMRPPDSPAIAPLNSLTRGPL